MVWGVRIFEDASGKLAVEAARLVSALDALEQFFHGWHSSEVHVEATRDPRKLRVGVVPASITIGAMSGNVFSKVAWLRVINPTLCAFAVEFHPGVTVRWPRVR